MEKERGLPKSIKDYKAAEGITPEFEEAARRGDILGNVDDALQDINIIAEEQLSWFNKEPLEPVEDVDKIKESGKVISPERLKIIEDLDGLHREMKNKLKEAAKETIGNSVLSGELYELIEKKIKPKLEGIKGKEAASPEVQEAFRYIFSQVEGFINEAKQNQGE